MNPYGPDTRAPNFLGKLRGSCYRSQRAEIGFDMGLQIYESYTQSYSDEGFRTRLNPRKSR